MKKKGIILLIIVVFISFYFFIFKEDKRQELIEEMTDELLKATDSIDEIVDKNTVYMEVNEKIDEAFVSLERNDYNMVVERINSVQYEDIKEKLIARTEELNNQITHKEELYRAKETITGKISAYTAYCSDGCSGYTASGRYVGGGNIYYNDKEYGTVMIVAGDKSYPFGTIVRFNNLKYFNRDVYAIVLDRGGAVGKNRRVLFDLLMANEKTANNFGIAKSVNCDILRIGY